MSEPTIEYAHPRPSSGASVAVRLSIMMFLEFFIWGAWYVTVGNYMGAHDMGGVIFWAYTVGPIAAIISPFFLGMVADRFFATERVLAVMHMVGGAALLAAPFFSPGDGGSHWPFIGILLIHMLCYMPTLGLTNTLAFHNLTNREKQFPIIRVFGTIGWIVANLVVSKWLGADKSAGAVLRRRRGRTAAGRLQLLPAAHAAAGQGQGPVDSRRARPRRARPDEGPLVHGLRHQLVPDLHSAGGLLQLRPGLRRCRRFRNPPRRCPSAR
jgi:hypothetical protein